MKAKKHSGGGGAGCEVRRKKEMDRRDMKTKDRSKQVKTEGIQIKVVRGNERTRDTT